jgi:uncharacterized protein YeaC (DUF1315 family)
MEYQDILQQLSPEVYASLKRALELGRWADGRALTDDQRHHCMQAIITYDRLHLPQEQRVGYIDRDRKQGQLCDTGDTDEQALRWDTGQPGGEPE